MFNHKSNRCAPRGGFTLLELLTFIASLVLVSAVLLPVFVQARRAAKVAAVPSPAAILASKSGAAPLTERAKPLPAPQLVGKELTISCAVTPKSRNGVILAQGGAMRGYALSLKDGKPIFSVRQNGKLYLATGAAAPQNRFTMSAHLGKDGKMSLQINGKTVASGKAPGVFTMQPKDGLSINQDSMSAVGNYKAPNPLQGKVEGVKIVAK